MGLTWAWHGLRLGREVCLYVKLPKIQERPISLLEFIGRLLKHNSTDQKQVFSPLVHVSVKPGWEMRKI